VSISRRETSSAAVDVVDRSHLVGDIADGDVTFSEPAVMSAEHGIKLEANALRESRETAVCFAVSSTTGNRWGAFRAAESSGMSAAVAETMGDAATSRPSNHARGVRCVLS
jgi:hypothetical protein